MNENEEPDYLTWSSSKPEPEPVEPEPTESVILSQEDLDSESQISEEAEPVEPTPDTRWEDALRAEPVVPAPDPEPEREPEPEITDWIAPDPIATAPIVDEPVVARTEPEEIVVPPSVDIEAVIDAVRADEEEDGDEDEIVFDLASLSTEERRHLGMRLTGAGIAHIWEVATDLVVAVKDAHAVERYVQEVQNPDGFGDEEMVEFETDEDVDDEEVYAAMSGLYVAADKLMQKPNDPGFRTAFYDATDDVDGLPAPFGFDPRVWAQVQELANSIADAMDAEAAVEAVADDARSLRQLLVNYV